MQCSRNWILYVIAQLGGGSYMFLVGLGFDRDHFRSNVGSAGAVSLSGMASPFLMAVALAPWLMSEGLFADSMSLFEATLFLGACIAITAFPMLARIIHERGLSRSPLGTLSLSAGAIDDACAWGVLAIVLATVGAGAGVAVKAIGSAVAFAAFMVLVGPKLFARLGREAEAKGGIDNCDGGSDHVHGLAAVRARLRSQGARTRRARPDCRRHR